MAEKSVLVAVRLTGEHMEALDGLGEAWGMNRSDVIRRALAEAFEAEKTPPPRSKHLTPPT